MKEQSRFNLPNPWVVVDFDSGVKEGAIIDSRLLAKKREESRDRIEAERFKSTRGTPFDTRVKMDRSEIRRVK